MKKDVLQSFAVRGNFEITSVERSRKPVHYQQVV